MGGYGLHERREIKRTDEKYRMYSRRHQRMKMVKINYVKRFVFMYIQKKVEAFFIAKKNISKKLKRKVKSMQFCWII